MPTACFTFTANCTLDWDGINAVATFVAGAIALGAAVIAVRAPQQTRLNDRSDATNEILEAAGEAIDLFRHAHQRFGKSTNSTSQIRAAGARASYLHTALDRIISRPELTDGAIVVAAGSMELLKAVESEAIRYITVPNTKFAPMIVSELDARVEVVPVILDRAKRVANYAVKRRWPKWRRRFAKIAEEGLRASDPQDNR